MVEASPTRGLSETSKNSKPPHGEGRVMQLVEESLDIFYGKIWYFLVFNNTFTCIIANIEIDNDFYNVIMALKT